MDTKMDVTVTASGETLSTYSTVERFCSTMSPNEVQVKVDL